MFIRFKVINDHQSQPGYFDTHPAPAARAGGVAEYSGFQVTGMIEWGQKWKPKKTLGLKTPPPPKKKNLDQDLPPLPPKKKKNSRKQ